MHVKFLETLDWSILIAYFLILITIGIWASSKRKKGSSLFLAENSLRWYHIGFSMWGTECRILPCWLLPQVPDLLPVLFRGIMPGMHLSLYVCLLLSLLPDIWVVASRHCPNLWENVSDKSTRNILAWYTYYLLFHGLHWLYLPVESWSVRSSIFLCGNRHCCYLSPPLSSRCSADWKLWPTRMYIKWYCWL